MKKFIIDIGWGFASSIATTLFSFLLNAILARWLGAADLGLYRIIISIYTITVILANFGIGVTLVKYVAEYKNNPGKLHQFISAGILISVIFGVSLGIICALLSEAVATFFHTPELAQPLRILSFIFPFNSIFQCLMGLLNGLRRMKLYSLFWVFQNILMVILSIIFVKMGLGVEGAVSGLVISNVIVSILAFWLCKDIVRFAIKNFNQTSRTLIHFSFQVFSVLIVSQILAQADILMVGFFLTAKEVGYYSVATVISQILTLLPFAIQLVTYPAASEYWSQNNHMALQNMLEKSIKFSLCILLPMGIGIAFFSQGIIQILFGNEFVSGITALNILLIGKTLRGGMIQPVFASFNGVGKPGVVLKLESISTIINLLLLFLFTPRFGIVGTAIATTVACIVEIFVSFIVLPRVLRVNIDLRWLLQIGLLSILVIVLFVIGSNFINSYLVGAIILVTFITLILLLFITPQDKDTLKLMAKSLVVGNRANKDDTPII